MKMWTFIHAEGHKVIFASPEVVGQVRAVLARREVDIFEETERDAVWVDNPGMCLVNRGIWSGAVDGLTIEIPVSDFHDFLRQIKQHLKDAAFNGDKDPNRGYRSIYGWHHCIALSQAQYEMLHDVMVAAADDVQEQADAENEKLSKAIHRANEEMAQAGANVTVMSAKADLLEKKQPIGGLWN